MVNLTRDGDVCMAKTVSYSNKLDEYKVIPSHINAMMAWNLLNDREDFKYGSKGKLFNIKGISLGKAPDNIKDNYYSKYMRQFPNAELDSIVLPEGVNKLPDYFIIDVDKTMRYSCDDRVKLLMSGLYTGSDTDLLF